MSTDLTAGKRYISIASGAFAVINLRPAVGVGQPNAFVIYLTGAGTATYQPCDMDGTVVPGSVAANAVNGNVVPASWPFYKVIAGGGQPCVVAAASVGIGAETGVLNALAATDTGLAVASYPIASEVHLGEVSGRGSEARDEFTRPNDANAYLANDVVSEDTNDTATTALRGLTLARKVGGGGYITFWELAVDHTTFLPRVRVHLYTHAAPVSALPGDNTLMVRKYANMPQKIGSFDLPALTLPGGAGAHDMVYALRDDLRIPFKCATADTKVYYRYEVLDAATPAANKKFYTTARADVD
jgi:hypothetical protein